MLFDSQIRFDNIDQSRNYRRLFSVRCRFRELEEYFYRGRYTENKVLSISEIGTVPKGGFSR